MVVLVVAVGPVGMSALPITEVTVEQEEHRHVRMVEQEEIKEMTETQEEMAPMEPMEQRDLPGLSAATVLRERTQQDFGNQELKRQMEQTVVEVLAAAAAAAAEDKHVLCVMMDLETGVPVEAVEAKVGKAELVVTEAAAPLEFILT